MASPVNNDSLPWIEFNEAVEKIRNDSDINDAYDKFHQICITSDDVPNFIIPSAAKMFKIYARFAQNIRAARIALKLSLALQFVVLKKDDSSPIAETWNAYETIHDFMADLVESTSAFKGQINLIKEYAKIPKATLGFEIADTAAELLICNLAEPKIAYGRISGFIQYMEIVKEFAINNFASSTHPDRYFCIAELHCVTSMELHFRKIGGIGDIDYAFNTMLNDFTTTLKKDVSGNLKRAYDLTIDCLLKHFFHRRRYLDYPNEPTDLVTRLKEDLFETTTAFSINTQANPDECIRVRAANLTLLAYMEMLQCARTNPSLHKSLEADLKLHEATAAQCADLVVDRLGNKEPFILLHVAKFEMERFHPNWKKAAKCLDDLTLNLASPAPDVRFTSEYMYQFHTYQIKVQLHLLIGFCRASKEADAKDTTDLLSGVEAEMLKDAPDWIKIIPFLASKDNTVIDMAAELQTASYMARDYAFRACIIAHDAKQLNNADPSIHNAESELLSHLDSDWHKLEKDFTTFKDAQKDPNDPIILSSSKIVTSSGYLIRQILEAQKSPKKRTHEQI